MTSRVNELYSGALSGWSLTVAGSDRRTGQRASALESVEPAGAQASSQPASLNQPATVLSLDALRRADESTIIAACLAGRHDAFDIIVERHRRAVYQVCYRFVSNHEDASDLAQEVFLRAYRGLGRFKTESSLATWLYRIAVNASLSRVARRAPVAEPLDPRRLDADAESQIERTLREERAATVRAAIARLPRKQRATLVLRIYQELSHEQIARILGSSVGTVKANFCHALCRLRQILTAGRESL